MALELWQMAQIKRVLNTFCRQHQVGLDHDEALEACNKLLRAAANDIDDPQQLYEHLCDSMHSQFSKAER